MIPKFPDLESAAHAAIDLTEAQALLDRFAGLTRESGSADERAAGEYLAARLRAFGVPVVVHEPELFLSVPERASLRLLDEAGGEIRCRPPAFSRPTGDVELTGELVYVPSRYAGGTADLFDTPMAAATAGGAADPVAGRIVLTEGYSMPGSVHAFERRGAVGQIFIHPGDAIHEGICTPIWARPPTSRSRASRARRSCACPTATAIG